ncbi:MAG: hypothetical protein IPI53_06485 [Saprospiraceae bacterium]|nr:hypothetical protein [Saprospiraceae bacterium]
MNEKRSLETLNNKQLQKHLNFAASSLYKKLLKLDLTSLQLSDYNQRYLRSKISKLESTLSLYSKLLFLSLKNSQFSLKTSVLVDYGGGSGVMSLLAAELGVGTVIYNDIYDVSCKDIEILSNALGLKPDHIVCGDVDDLVSYLQEKSISINVIVSYDVLEHIYDVDSHFKNLGRLSGSVFRIVYASGANIENPFYVRSVTKQQIKAEYETREKIWGHKERDSLLAFFEIRKQIISAYAPDLNPETVDYLAHCTRGLIQADIEKCIEEFRSTGNITYRIDHPTNTCDPYTGNWCEHLMDLEQLKGMVSNSGFSAQIITGRYPAGGSFLLRLVKLLLNVILQIMGRRGMFVAPYYVLLAESDQQGAIQSVD